jgi:hypothetical protein
MISLRRIAGAVCGLAVLSCLLACGISGRVRQAAQRAQTSNDLKLLGLSYHNFHDTNKRGPASTNEWAQWAQKSGADPMTLSVIQQTGPGGKYVMYWNAKIPGDFPAGTSNTVLGYESNVPTSGGQVLMADASVQQMSAAEFNSAAKPANVKK